MIETLYVVTGFFLGVSALQGWLLLSQIREKKSTEKEESKRAFRNEMFKIKAEIEGIKDVLSSLKTEKDTSKDYGKTNKTREVSGF